MKLKRIEIAKLCLVSALVLVSATSAEAQTVVKKLDTTGKKENVVKFSSEFVGTYSSGLQKVDAVDYSSTFDFEATLAATVRETKLYVSTGVSKELTNQREAGISNAYIGATRSLYKFNDQFSLSGDAKVTLPFSEASKDYQRQITGISVTPSLSWKSDFGLSLRYSFSGVTNFHKYKTAMTGASNYQYVASNAIAATYQFASGLYLYANASYSRLFTYHNNTKDSYKFMQIVGYPIDNFDLAVGHVMGGTPLAANGIETDVRFFDSRDSVIFGMLTVSF